eukprot:TRINITY_DN2178_c0_g1_i1.p1 TRINITY_DN2178_c0_g1~~TRINITY_DN2178_c0_g1_i1.p1  ORF type:complete len:195 (-),score=73.63 TRINITY_DN2178_c0_g1_i1:120-704(-)
MGNTQARNRLKAQDFHYIAKNTAFLTKDVVSDYHKEVIESSSVGKIDAEVFKKIFRLAFPERPEDKLDALIEKIRNVEKTDGSIPIHSIAMLIYLFCDGKTEDNLGQMFNLFDNDGNGAISIDELLNMMAFFIEIGMDTGNVDMAMVMSEVFLKGDKNKDEKLNKQEFVSGMTQHPVTSKILGVKTIDALLATF